MIRDEATHGHSILELCEMLEVSASGYYAWATRKPGKRQNADQELTEQIREVHKASRKTYGSPRITRVLHRQSVIGGKKRVARIMKENGIRGAQKARFRPRTTDSRHDLPISPNRMEDIAFIDHLNQIWASDITYIPTLEGWLYLAAFMDLKSRKITGWRIRDNMKTDLVEDAFLQAVFRNQPGAGLIAHSDRGSRHASHQFRKTLAQHHCISSMAGKGHCYDNAAMESFWATLKTDMSITKPFRTKKEAKLAIFDYIEVFYNRRRMHSAIGDLSPLDYELKLVA